MLPIHPAFVQIHPFLLNEIIEKAGITRTGGIVNSQESNQIELPQYSDIQILEVNKLIADNQIRAIAGGIAGGIANKFIGVLESASAAKSRKEILTKLNLVNNANNFETYIQPLVTHCISYNIRYFHTISFRANAMYLSRLLRKKRTFFKLFLF